MKSYLKKSQIALWLAIFLFGMLGTGQNAIAQTKDTLWTRDVWPLTLINGVFSPDDQFIYATCLQNNTDYLVRKYNLNGDLISKIDTIGGIRQFSEDGRFFWNYSGDKYDANTFLKIFSFGGGGHNISKWFWSITESNDIGVVATDDGKFKDTENRTYYFDNLKIFQPSNSKILMDTAYPGNIFTFNAVSIKPNSKEVAFLVQSIARDYKGNFFTDTSRIEIWDLTSFSKKKEIQIQKPKNFGDGLLLKYSPDGSVLGYQHDGNLTLYSTTDYSVVWESDDSLFPRIFNFTWTKNNANMFLSFYADLKFMGICRLNNLNKSFEKVYIPSSGTEFINFNSDLTQIITNLSDSLELLYYRPESIQDDFFDNFKINCFAKSTSNILRIELVSSNSYKSIISIVDTIGFTVIPQKEFPIYEKSNVWEFDISFLKSGTYFVRIQIDGHSYEVKFAIVR